MTTPPPLADLVRAVRNTLTYMKASGCKGFDCSPETLKTLADLRVMRPDARTTDDGRGTPPHPAPETLESIRADLGECTRCQLCRRRTHIVFGEGDPRARLVFVGEGPGYEEDQSGRPFVGPAGQLLTRIIAAMGLSREAVYICNVVKCRPEGNRNPEPDEIACCLPFLNRQLTAIGPQVVCALGGVAAKTLLDTDAPISRLRGRFHTVMGMSVMPTYHPAYLLRNPEKKRDVWADVQLIMKRLG